VNNTVTWTNYDPAQHTVTSSSVPAGAASFDSGTLAAATIAVMNPKSGGTFTETFTVPGTYQFHCNFHSWMTGTVVVKAATAPVPEFPVSSLAVILFAVIAAAALAVPRLRPPSSRGLAAGRSRPTPSGIA
jgi:hypothetical protein